MALIADNAVGNDIVDVCVIGAVLFEVLDQKRLLPHRVLVREDEFADGAQSEQGRIGFLLHVILKSEISSLGYGFPPQPSPYRIVFSNAIA